MRECSPTLHLDGVYLASNGGPGTNPKPMRECWINVSVVGFRAGREAVLGSMWDTRAQAVAVGEYSQYRLHVRLKVPALPVTDALAAGKAGEGSHIQQEPRHG